MGFARSPLAVSRSSRRIRDVDVQRGQDEGGHGTKRAADKMVCVKLDF